MRIKWSALLIVLRSRSRRFEARHCHDVSGIHTLAKSGSQVVIDQFLLAPLWKHSRPRCEQEPGLFDFHAARRLAGLKPRDFAEVQIPTAAVSHTHGFLLLFVNDLFDDH